MSSSIVVTGDGSVLTRQLHGSDVERIDWRTDANARRGFRFGVTPAGVALQ